MKQNGRWPNGKPDKREFFVAGVPRVIRRLGPDDFLSTRELSERLGVEKPRIGRWMKNYREKGREQRIPEPGVQIGAGPIWLVEWIDELEAGTPPGEIKVVPLDLVGTREAGEILDMKRDRIGAWLREGAMPEPLARLKAGPLWWRTDVVRLIPEREARRRIAVER